jgi:thioredoxin 1
VIDLTSETFEKEVIDSDVPVIVDVWAPHCPPCERIEPHLEAIAAENAGRVRLAKLNVEANLWFASRYGILSVPTVMLFVGGEPKETLLGAHPRARFERAFAPHL